MFIAVEGPDGAGKSTLVGRLRARLEAGGRHVVTVREPGGTAVAEGVRRIVLDPEHTIGPAAELFLMLAARADLVAQVIEPALAAGKIVLADRFTLSTIAYQAHGRNLPRDDVVRAIELSTGGLYPDLTLVLDIDATRARARRDAGDAPDRMERESESFHERVAEAFRAAEGPGIVHVNADGSPDDVCGAVWTVVEARAPEAFR